VLSVVLLKEVVMDRSSNGWVRLFIAVAAIASIGSALMAVADFLAEAGAGHLKWSI
jgi:hypothetical protein